MHVLKHLGFAKELAVGMIALMIATEPARGQTSSCNLRVTSTLDSGEGSLREAIGCANTQAGADTITFAIPGTGPHVIQLASALPELNGPVTIDGFSQPDAGANTSISTLTDARVRIELRGQPGIEFGLVAAANDCVVRGLALNSFDVAGLRLSAQRAVVQGNYLGLDAVGALELPNLRTGILVEGADHLIGGTAPAARNVIAGNRGPGITLENPAALAANGSRVVGNVIGLSPSGAVASNTTGILVNDAAQVQIGGIEPGAANVISGNLGAGVVVVGPRAWAAIAGNAIDLNGGLGIDLQAQSGPLLGDGVTKDDPMDLDEGPNTLLNSPVLIDDFSTPSSTFIVGCLHSKAGESFYIDFYAVDQCDPSGRGEGRRHLGRVLTQVNKLWNADFTLQVSPPLMADTYVTATATTVDGRTSEFSPCRRITGSSTSTLGKLAVGLNSSPNPVTVGTPLTYTISITNLGPGKVDEVSLINQLPSGLNNVVVKVGSEQCLITDGKLLCALGTLTNGQVVSVVFEGTPSRPGIYVDTVTVHGISNAKPLEPVTATHETLAVNQPVLQISDTSAVEGPGAQATFTVSLSQPSAFPITVVWGTVDGTAKAGSDFTGSTGQTLIFAPGETTKTLSIPILDDSVAESPEQFTVHLSTPTNGQIGKADGVAQLTDNDTTRAPVLAMGVISSPNPATVGIPLTYTISITNLGPGTLDAVSLINQLPAGLSNVVIKVGGNTCTLADGKVSCEFGSLPEGGVLTVVIEGIPTTPGVYLDTVTASGASGGKPVAPVTVLHETQVLDQPILTISNTTATEGPGAQAIFTVSLSRPSTTPITVTWSTVDGTAKAGSDFTGATSQSLTFAPGETSKTLSVAIVDDTLSESPEQFTVHLSASVNAQIGRADGTAELTDNDEPTLPVLAVGVTSSPNPVTVGTPVTYTISVTNLGPGTLDAVSLINQLPPGLSNVVIKVGGNTCTIVDGVISCEFGSLPEGGVLTVVIEGIPTTPGVYIDTVTASGTSGGKPVVPVTVTQETRVIDQPVFTMSDTTVTEGPVAQATFTITLSRPSTLPALVTWRTIDGSAKAGTDFTGMTGQLLTFAPGQTSKTVSITILDDDVAESPEQFTVRLSSAINAQIGKAEGVAELLDNDSAPLPILAVGISSSPTTGVVGSPITYTLSVTNLGPGTIDAVSLANLLPPGLSNVVIKVGGNLCVIADDTLSCELGTLTEGQVVEVIFEGVPTQAGTYVDMVVVTGTSAGRPVVPATAELETTVLAQPILSISDTTVAEGPGALATFTVTLSRPSTEPVTVMWGTVDGTAKAGSDFTGTTGQTLTFDPGETTKTISVPLIDDSVAEADEQFTVSLSTPVNAQIGKPDGIAQLTDADEDDEGELPTLSITLTSAPEPATVGLPMTYTIGLTNDGPGTVDLVSLVNLLPPGLSNVVIKVGGDRCVLTNGEFSCEFGTLAPGQGITVVFEGIPTQSGVILDSVTATGTSGGREIEPATEVLGSTVLDQPTITVTDTSVTEGPGVQANFAVTLSRAVSFPVIVSWGTVDGTATTGEDYLGVTTETLTFQPGETTKALVIPIVDDSTAEPIESFKVRLRDSINAAIATLEASAEIQDDDEATLLADVGIAQLTGPLSVLVGQDAIYNLTLTNRGPDRMGGLFLTNTVPLGARLVSVTMNGTNAPCIATNDVLICTLGALEPGASLPLRFVFSTEVAGTLTNRFIIAGEGATDPDVTNNSAEIQTPVQELPSDDLIASFQTEMKLNRQTGLLEQRLKVTNNGTTPKPRVRVLFHDLPEGGTVYNAAGSEEGVPFVQLNETLQPGESRELTIEYYLPKRAKIPNPRLIMRTGGGLLPVVAEGVAIDVSRTVVLSPNRFLLEFVCEPGKVYQVQYSDDGQTWSRAQPIVRAVNTRLQWLDDGPPKTDTAPSETPMRLYRVFTVPE
ncbi:MAG: DUF11 domain-containing protein [Verrucomicrobiales bacterium]|nr:DUF11 domain-containing protein [Verrucomicrobiales bacterium]